MSGKGSGARDPARRKCTDAEYGERWEATFLSPEERLKMAYLPGFLEVVDAGIVAGESFEEEMRRMLIEAATRRSAVADLFEADD